MKTRPATGNFLTMRTVLLIAFLLPATGLLLSCQPQAKLPDAPTEHHEEARSAVTLPVLKVVKEQLRKVLQVPGRVSALPDHSVQVTPHITGKIERLLVVPGQHVKKGQLVAVLDDSQTQALLRQALTPIKSANAAIQQAEAEYDLAKRELQRLNDLYANDLAARKDVMVQETLVETSNAKLAAAKARLEEVRSATSDEETLLKFTKIPSPISGVVADRFLNVGDEARPNAPIVHVVDLSEVIVDADMPADVPNRVGIGQKASVSSISEPDQIYSATIISISPTVDAQKNTVKIRLQCVNLNNGLREGQSVTVALNTGVTTAAISVPRTAIVPDPENPKLTLVYVVRGGKAKRIPVVTGVENDKTIEIVSGLGENEAIIVSGAYGLPEDTEVTPANE